MCVTDHLLPLLLLLPLRAPSESDLHSFLCVQLACLSVIMAAIYWILFTLGINLPGLFSCPLNCECYQFKSVCRILFDIDELHLDTELLVVEGVLRAKHYVQLAQKPGLKKELHDCSCRTLQNCE